MHEHRSFGLWCMGRTPQRAPPPKKKRIHTGTQISEKNQIQTNNSYCIHHTTLGGENEAEKYSQIIPMFLGSIHKEHLVQAQGTIAWNRGHPSTQRIHQTIYQLDYCWVLLTVDCYGQPLLDNFLLSLLGINLPHILTLANGHQFAHQNLHSNSHLVIF